MFKKMIIGFLYFEMISWVIMAIILALDGNDNYFGRIFLSSIFMCTIAIIETLRTDQ